MKRLRVIGASLVAAALFWSATSAEAQPAAKAAGQKEEVPTVQLALHPASEPKAALEYQLLPGMMQRRPGNAAVLYNKIGLSLGNEGAGKMSEESEAWREMPLAKLPREEVRKMLEKYRQVLDDLDLAARYESCDWQLPLRERNFFALLLPELQMTRGFARLLAVKARLEIAENKPDEALRTLQTGFALARHVAEGPTLVNGLVGVAIVQMMAGQVETLLGQPGAPNLYWALTSLPRPLVDLRKAIETEMNAPYLIFPELAHVGDTQRTTDYWQAFVEKLGKEVSGLTGDPMPSWQARLGMTFLTVKGYPKAKRHLIAEGRSAEEVESLPASQVVAIYTVETYNELRDRMFKWFYVPYPEAREGLRQAEQYLKDEGKQREIVPLASLLVPTVGAAHAAAVRCDRRIAILRTIEALRIYAAAHDGRLPEKLADVAEVPVPGDPMTGQAFVYRLQNDTALLEAPAPPGLSPASYGQRYEIKINR